MADILNRLGSDFASRLVKACGGRRLYIPTRMPTRGPLLDHFTQDEIQQLIGVAGGVHVDVPVGAGNAYGRARRRAEGMLRDGATINAVANQVGLARRTVYAIKARLRDLGEVPSRGQAS